MLAVFGVVEFAFVLLSLAFAVLSTIFWAWMLVECATKEPANGNDKIVWILIILLTHCLGALLYFFIRKPRRLAETGN